jgi:hypothetical protein
MAIFGQDGQPSVFEDEESTTVGPIVGDSINKVESGVGGEPEEKEAVKTSFEAIRSAIDQIPSEYFNNPQNEGVIKLYELFKKSDRAKMIKKYVEAESNTADPYLRKIDFIKIPEDLVNHFGLVDVLVPTMGRLSKIAQMIDGQMIGTNEAVELSDEDTSEILRETAVLARKKSDEIRQRILNRHSDAIESVPVTIDGESILRALIAIFKQAGSQSELEPKIQEKQKKIDDAAGKTSRRDSELVKDKFRVTRRLIDAILLAQLPAITDGKIAVSGDYYKLFKALEKEDSETGTTFMKVALENHVFKNNQTALAEFTNRATAEESPLEEDQLNYLGASRSWIHSYIVNKSNGNLTQKEEENQINRLNSAYTEKTKSIKNYYLARDFNLGNFGGIQLKPEIRLPLYTKVSLPVTKEDRIKESPIRNFMGGIGKVITGLFAAIPDRMNAETANAAAARNKAIFSGISSIVKAGVTVIGGKQAGRDYAEKVEKPLLGKKEKGIKEDMLAVSDAPGFTPVNPEAPGQAMQTPDQMVPNNMDTLALAGPGKKAKKKEEKKLVGSRVMSFSEFLDRKSKV